MSVESVINLFRNKINLDKEIKCKYCDKEYTPVSIKIFGEELIIPKSNCDCKEINSQIELRKETEKKEEKEMFERYPFLIDYRRKDVNIENMLKNLDTVQTTTTKILKKYGEDYINGHKKSVYLYGSSGTGKTSLTKRLACWFRKNGIDSYMVDTQKLLASYKNSYGSNYLPYYATEYNIDSIVTSNKLLILDDVGTEKASEWTVSKFMFIFNERVENNKPTIVTTNYSPEELIIRFEQAVGEVEARRLVGRMVYNSLQIENTTKDYRF